VVGWIESQRPEIIVLVVFGCSYVVVALLLIASAPLAKRTIGADLKATTPVMLTPLSVIIGLLIAFLATRVWNNLDRASGYVAQEASSIRECLVLGAELPPEIRDSFRQQIRVYLHFIETDDWPAMSVREATLTETPEGLAEAVHTVVSFNPTTRSQEVIQQHLVRAIERALEARRYRILLSQGSLSPLQWLVIVILDVLLLATIAMVHVERPRTALINMFALSTGIAACLALLMVHDRGRQLSAMGFSRSLPTLLPTDRRPQHRQSRPPGHTASRVAFRPNPGDGRQCWKPVSDQRLPSSDDGGDPLRIAPRAAARCGRNLQQLLQQQRRAIRPVACRIEAPLELARPTVHQATHRPAAEPLAQVV
jgi:hypothetical protein